MHLPLDTSAQIAVSATRPLVISSLGTLGLIAIDKEVGWIDIEAVMATVPRPESSTTVTTPAGPAGMIDLAPTSTARFEVRAFVDVPADDFDIAVTIRIAGEDEAQAQTLARELLGTLELTGPPATSTASSTATASHVPDAALDAWLPSTLAGLPATYVTSNGRGNWGINAMTLVLSEPGSPYSHCAELATTIDDLGFVTGSIEAPGGSLNLIGCRVRGAAPNAWVEAIPATPMEGTSRPTYAFATENGVARWVVAGSALVAIGGPSDAAVEAVVADLPSDLPP